MFKGLLIGIVVGVLLVGVLVYFYFSTGRAPAATTDPPMPFENRLAKMALNAHIDKQRVGDALVAADEKNYLSGVGVYKKNCVVCHGLPGEPKSFIAEGMYPRPPQLFQGVGVTDDPASETYWKVENGIRLTGMPGFKGRLSETEIWQVSLLLANADKIPASVKAALTTAPATPQTAPPSAAPPAKK
jgi:mono/diheme cytochrome c family protein